MCIQPAFAANALARLDTPTAPNPLITQLANPPNSLATAAHIDINTQLPHPPHDNRAAVAAWLAARLNQSAWQSAHSMPSILQGETDAT